jgi:hypothetical protein
LVVVVELVEQILEAPYRAGRVVVVVAREPLGEPLQMLAAFHLIPILVE